MPSTSQLGELAGTMVSTLTPDPGRAAARSRHCNTATGRVGWYKKGLAHSMPKAWIVSTLTPDPGRAMPSTPCAGRAAARSFVLRWVCTTVVSSHRIAHLLTDCTERNLTSLIATAPICSLPCCNCILLSATIFVGMTANYFSRDRQRKAVLSHPRRRVDGDGK